MPSYRRHVARHPQARSRALRFVRRHAWQTGPRPTPNPLGLIPYAQQFVIEGESGPDGVPATAMITGLGLPSVVRESMQAMSRDHFWHLHPGVEIVRERWENLYETGDDE